MNEGDNRAKMHSEQNLQQLDAAAQVAVHQLTEIINQHFFSDNRYYVCVR